MFDKLTKREKFNLSFFYPKYFDEQKSLEIVQRISELGEKTGFIGNQGGDKRRKHKYDTWIAKTVKDHLKTLQKAKKPLNLEILDQEIEFQNILDWMIAEKIDAFQYTFSEALRAQELWHQEMAQKMQIEKIENPDIDRGRIIYRCKNQEYFFYLLNHNELKFEGVNMGHCVGGTHYQNKVKGETSLIISLRDKDNKPHVTTEILISKDKMDIKGIVSQCQGKPKESENSLSRKPNPKYLEMIQEFVLFASDFYEDETMKFMNKDYF